METKTCSLCNETKPVTEFYKRTDLKNGIGYRSYCKSCHISKNKTTSKAWRSNNKSHRNAYMQERRQNDSSIRIVENLRRHTLYALNGNQKANKTLDMLGCSIEHLKDHLQATAIDNGYINFDIESFSGEDYHIDHIIPCSKFNLSIPEEQLKCFHYTNLQILSATDNLSKSDKLL